MLQGSRVTLRPVAPEDLEAFNRSRSDIATRGTWVPLPRTSAASLQADYARNGWWSSDDGVFVMDIPERPVAGYVAWGQLNGSIPDVELAYGVFDRALMGRGLTTEAVGLLADYLFGAYRMQRLVMYIHPENLGSIRVAEKNGFEREARLREAWFDRGRWQDVEYWALGRSAWEARRSG